MAATAESLLATIEASQLLTVEELNKARTVASQATDHSDGMEVARQLVRQGVLTRWQAEQLLAGKTNLILGKYKLLERIGKGGMGTVYRANHTVMGRDVAIKVMAPSLLNDAQAVARFEREVRSAAKLNHPNIVAAYDADCVGKTHFLVMEYIEGQDLTRRIHGVGPVPIDWACECVRQAAVGLQHAHEHGMVHRDLKPSNLLVATSRSDGRFLVKILDMGLARFASSATDDSGLTHSGQIIGTPDYMAPEQVEDTRRADIRSDIFSLGCTLFRLLAGHVPFGGETVMGKLMARMQFAAPRVSLSRSDVPPDLDALVARMLAIDPAARPQTPAEVANELARFARHGGSEFAETIALAIPVDPTAVGSPVSPTPAPTPSPTPTHLDAHSPTPRSSDPKLNEFLLHLAQNASKTRRRESGTSQHEPPRADEGPASGNPAEGHEKPAELARPRGFRSRRLIVVVAAACALVAAGLPFLWMWGEPNPVALDGDEASASQESSSSESTAQPLETKTPTKVFVSPLANAPSLNASDSNPSAGNATGPSPESSRGPSNAPPTTAPDTGTANATPEPGAMPQTPAQPAHDPQVLIVGDGPGQYPDLKAVFEKAGPGDRIVIQHVGPFEFAPVDLTGKTPLTIEGGSENGVDYWPIVRQAVATQEAKSRQATDGPPAWFMGQDLNLTVRKVHLAASGPKRANIAALFGLGSGRVELNDCTVTVGVQGSPNESPGSPIALIRADPAPNGRVEFVARRTFFRGERLQSCIEAGKTLLIDVDLAQTTWAGGPAPWLVVRDPQHPVQLTLSQCAFYNTSSLVTWESSAAQGTPGATFEAQVDHCLFIGPRANRAPFIDWNPGEPAANLVAAADNGILSWQGANNTFHRFNGYFDTGRQPAAANLEAWQSLWSQSSPNLDRQVDPFLRVWPEGYLLQESHPRDFQPRVGRNLRSDQRAVVIESGPIVNELPAAVANIFARRLPVAGEERAPRGQPRILRVHQQEGPYKTIEAAIAEMRSDDIVEIADSGTYRPVRNFSTHPAPAILFSPTLKYVTVRAADGANPVVMLDESVQQGALPAPTPDQTMLILFQFPVAEGVHLEGLHVRYRTAANTYRGAITLGELPNHFFRCANCTFVDVPAGRGALAYGSTECFAHISFGSTLSTSWLENNLYWTNSGSSRAVVCYASSSGVYTLVRNCVCQGAFYRGWGGGHSVDVHSSTFLGIALEAKQAATVTVGTSVDNLAIVPPGTSLESAVPLPGPALAAPPRFEGVGSTKDPYRGYRLRKGQPAATMAWDGGPLGARLEYLPDPPASP